MLQILRATAQDAHRSAASALAESNSIFGATIRYPELWSIDTLLRKNSRELTCSWFVVRLIPPLFPMLHEDFNFRGLRGLGGFTTGARVPVRTS